VLEEILLIDLFDDDLDITWDTGMLWFSLFESRYSMAILQVVFGQAWHSAIVSAFDLVYGWFSE
jgi:hypothetical protein